MLFAKKPVVFDCVQVSRVSISEHPFTAFSEMPDWLAIALARGDVRPVGSRGNQPDPFWIFELASINPGGKAMPLDYIAQVQDDRGVTESYLETGDIVVLHSQFLMKHYERITMPTTPDEAPIGHPEPPHETDLGADSTAAPDLAVVAEDQLQAEEVATDE